MINWSFFINIGSKHRQLKHCLRIIELVFQLSNENSLSIGVNRIVFQLSNENSLSIGVKRTVFQLSNENSLSVV